MISLRFVQIWCMDISMKISDIIEQCLLEMLDTGQDITLQRNELAVKFSCAPSQINYVISTRFTGQRGYIVESQRGGGGYIRIKRIDINESNYLMHVVGSVGSSISFATVHALSKNMVDANIISNREMRLMCIALSDKAMPLEQPQRDIQRAEIFKNMLVSLV